MPGILAQLWNGNLKPIDTFGGDNPEMQVHRESYLRYIQRQDPRLSHMVGLCTWHSDRPGSRKQYEVKRTHPRHRSHELYFPSAQTRP